METRHKFLILFLIICIVLIVLIIRKDIRVNPDSPASPPPPLSNEDGNEVRWWTVERFIFNDSGQIVHHGDINEDLLIAQQNGYKLSK